jgi:hypothetical protein
MRLVDSLFEMLDEFMRKLRGVFSGVRLCHRTASQSHAVSPLTPTVATND